MTSIDLDNTMARMQLSFGARVGRPVVHGGVVALPTALAPTRENLAALVDAWRFDTEPPREGEEAGR